LGKYFSIIPFFCILILQQNNCQILVIHPLQDIFIAYDPFGINELKDLSGKYQVSGSHSIAPAAFILLVYCFTIRGNEINLPLLIIDFQQPAILKISNLTVKNKIGFELFQNTILFGSNFFIVFIDGKIKRGNQFVMHPRGTLLKLETKPSLPGEKQEDENGSENKE